MIDRWRDLDMFGWIRMAGNRGILVRALRGALLSDPDLDIGRPPEHDLRVLVDAILYLDRTGIAWRYLPHDYPPWQTVCF
jgi:transposase